MERAHLLISDLDGTLLGDDTALQRFARWYEGRRRQLRLVYDTGRFFDDVAAVISATALPQPDAVIVAVGTEIRSYPAGKPLANGWPPRLGAWDPDVIRAVLKRHPALEPQPAQFQSQFKLSYFAYDLDSAVLADLRRRLVEAGQCAEIIYSSARDLDVLPGGVNKGAAAAALASAWGFPASRVFVSGDTGNDAALFVRGFLGIVVANAHAELKQIRSAEVYHSRQPFAAGVQEGLEHWLARAGSQSESSDSGSACR